MAAEVMGVEADLAEAAAIEVEEAQVDLADEVEAHIVEEVMEAEVEVLVEVLVEVVMEEIDLEAIS